MARFRLVIAGAGGLARDVEWLSREITLAGGTRFEFVGYIVSDLTKISARDSKSQIIGDLDWLEKNVKNVDGLAIGIGTPKARLDVARELTARFPQLEWPSLVHPSARYDAASCRIEAGVQICAGTYGTVNVKVGRYTMLNLGCTVGHETVIGEGCVVNPGANISGGVTIGDGVLVGSGAQILQYLSVGDGAKIGAGAVVIKDVPAHTTVIGYLAKALGAQH